MIKQLPKDNGWCTMPHEPNKHEPWGTEWHDINADGEIAKRYVWCKCNQAIMVQTLLPKASKEGNYSDWQTVEVTQ